MTEYEATRYFICNGVDCNECYYKVCGELHSGCWLIEHFHSYDRESRFNHEIYRVLQQRPDIINRQKNNRPNLWAIIGKYFGARLG